MPPWNEFVTQMEAWFWSQAIACKCTAPSSGDPFPAVTVNVRMRCGNQLLRLQSVVSLQEIDSAMNTRYIAENVGRRMLAELRLLPFSPSTSLC